MVQLSLKSSLIQLTLGDKKHFTFLASLELSEGINLAL